MSDTTTVAPATPTRRRAELRIDGLLLKRLLLGFWAMYFSIVALSNAIDLLDALGVLHWKFLDSGNFAYLRSVVKVYDIGPGLTKALLAGAFVVELAGAVLFWRALLHRGPGRTAVALRALCWGALVWIMFVFMTEFFVAYTSESTFRELLTITIATALVVLLVRDDAGADQPAIE
jgi:hypothetical protein